MDFCKELSMSTSDWIQAVAAVINVGVLVVYAFTLAAIKRQATVAERQAAIAEATAQQALNSSFLQLFPIVERHHSCEVADYRRFARNDLKLACDAARAAGKSLKDHNPNAAKVVSNIANYYESIGMLVEHGKMNLLPDVVNILIDMVHVSAHDIWEMFHDNMDVIHPAPLSSWAGSF